MQQEWGLSVWRSPSLWVVGVAECCRASELHHISFKWPVTESITDLPGKGTGQQAFMTSGIGTKGSTG